MAPRTTISLPDYLIERLDPFKGDFNISEICRRALSEHIGVYEVIQKALNDDDQLTAAVARLRAEKVEAAAWLKTRAVSEGLEWAMKEASYKELQEWGEGLEDLENDSRLDLYEDVKLPPADYVRERIDEMKHEAEFSDRVWDFSTYALSFLEGVRQAWAQIEHRL